MENKPTYTKARYIPVVRLFYLCYIYLIWDLSRRGVTAVIGIC